MPRGPRRRAVRVGRAGDATARRGCRDRRSGPCGGDPAVVELWEVVRRRDQAPFASAGGSAPALEAFDRAVELDLAEDRLDGDLSLAVEGPAFGRGEHAAHEVVKASVPAGPGAFAQAAVGRYEDLHAVRNDVLDLALVPVARVGEHDLRVAEPVPAEFTSGRVHHRFEVAEVG